MKSPVPDVALRLDVRVMLEAALRMFAAWLAAVVLVAGAGYPGVICVTPLAWLMALSVGVRCAARSSSAGRRQRVLEAALAGGLLGLLQGVLFVVMVSRLETTTAAEEASAAWVSAGVLLVGVLVSTGLAAANAWVSERRRVGQAES